MKYNIVFSDLANITLEYNLAFIKSFNSNFALKIQKQIINAINDLVIFPNAYPIYQKIDDYIYRKVLVNNIYHIVFL